MGARTLRTVLAIAQRWRHRCRRLEADNRKQHVLSLADAKVAIQQKEVIDALEKRVESLEMEVRDRDERLKLADITIKGLMAENKRHLQRLLAEAQIDATRIRRAEMGDTGEMNNANNAGPVY